MSGVWERGFDGGAGVPFLWISHRDEDSGAIETVVRHSAGRSPAIVVAVFLVVGFFLADYPVDCGVEPAGFRGPAHLSGPRYARTRSFLQVLPGIRCA